MDLKIKRDIESCQQVVSKILADYASGSIITARCPHRLHLALQQATGILY